VGIVAVFNTTNRAAPAMTLQRQMNEAALSLLKP
jgi:hypothetical protein